MMHETSVKGFDFIVHSCKGVFELLSKLDKISHLFIRETDPKVDETRIMFSAQVDRFIVER